VIGFFRKPAAPSEKANSGSSHTEQTITGM